AQAQTTAAEKADKRLADLLAPASKASLTGFAMKPLQWPPARTVVEISLPIKPYAGVPVRLPQPPRQEVKVRPPAEATPLVAYREPPVVPKLVELPAQAL